MLASLASSASIVYGAVLMGIGVAAALASAFMLSRLQLPSTTTLNQRLSEVPLDNLPISAPVKIYWSIHGVPYIDAQTDADLLFVVGLVQAHLRLTQMEMMRRVSQGRVSEMAGPFATDIDKSLRILNLGKATPAILEAMPSESRNLLDRYVDGINTYISRLKILPTDFRLLGLKKERWSPSDVITLSRLFSVEVNWLVLGKLLSIADKPHFQEVFTRILESGRASPISFTSSSAFEAILTSVSKSGSNSLVISGSKSKNSAGLIASDPHVGFSIPNLWVLAAYSSPSINVVGLTFPGFPFILLGRNRRIAWGGTNGWALTTSLYDVSNERVSTKYEYIKRRWWIGKKISIRESRLGPVVSDAPVLKGYKGKPFALRWVGHEVSDEFTAFLRVNRAKCFDEFRQSFETYAVSAQNFLYADVEGNIGRILALRSPVEATARPSELIHDPFDDSLCWKRYRNTLDIPAAYNPEQGFLVSANNKATDMDPPVAIFYAPADRFERLSSMLSTEEKVGIEELMKVQMDVYGVTSHRLCLSLLMRLEEQAHQHPLFIALAKWNGCYDAGSQGAYAFELLHSHLVEIYLVKRYGADIFQALSTPLIQSFLDQDMQSEEKCSIFDASLKEAFAKAAYEFNPEMKWQDVHFLELKHVLSRMPFVGSGYMFDRFAVPGSSSTVMKTAHSGARDIHTTTYGAVARHVSDLSDLDKNYFVLLGGEDGFIGSENLLDQVALWRRGEYVKVPLRKETAARDSFASQVLKGS